MLPKLLFHVTSDQLAAFRWQRGTLTPGPVLRADADGLAAFGRYLDAHADVPAWLVADLVEEDFQRQMLPHVGGRAGRGMVERRLAQHYRDTPLRHAALQERDDEGRRDDHALFSALTNPALVQPWLDVIEQLQHPLAAAYSAAHLSALLARRLALAQEHLLLITEQAGGLRQSYFQGPYLKFSRLTALAAGEDVAAATAQETARMQQFLTSTRLLPRGGMLQVAIVAPDARLAALERDCEDGPETSFHFVGLQAAADLFGLAEVPPDSQRLLLDVVARQAPASQYALPSPRRFYRIWQGRIALNGLAAMCALVAGLWLLSDASAIVDARAASEQLLADTARDDARYRAAMASLPAGPVKAANMKAAALLESQLATHAPAPAQLATLVSHALERAPAIRLIGFDWQAGTPAPTAPDQMAGTSQASGPIPASELGLPNAPPQTLRIDGEIEAAQSDFRTIVDNVNQFAYEMARNPGVAVEIVESPIDIRQNVKLTGSTGPQDIGSKPRFVLKVTWKP